MGGSRLSALPLAGGRPPALRGAEVNAALWEPRRAAGGGALLSSGVPQQGRNFHAFYQLLGGAPRDLRAELRLGALEDYALLQRDGVLAYATYSNPLTEAEKTFVPASLPEADRTAALARLHKGKDVFIDTCSRCHTVIEPYLSWQWFGRMAPLAAPAIEAAKKGRVRFYRAVRVSGNSP